MLGSLAGELLDDQIKLRKFLAGEAVTENGREVAVLLGKQGQVAFSAADVPSKDHPLPLVIPSFKSVQEILQLALARNVLGVIPPAAVAFEQKIGLSRPPASRRVLRHGGRTRCAPDVEDGIHEGPRSFDAVAAIEERGVAAQAVVQQSSVCAAAGITKSLAVAEIHGDVSNAHLCAGPLGAKADGNSFVGLDVEHQAIGLHFALAENDVRGSMKLNHDFGAAFCEPFASADVKRHAGPAPVINQQSCGYESFGFRSWIDPGLFPIAGNRLISDSSRGVLSADNRLRHHFEVERTDGLENFQLFIAHGGGVESRGRLYRHQRSQLQDVALNHVAQRAGGLVKASAALHTKRFGRGDLHVVHVIAVPEGLKDSVAEAQDEQVLDRVFSEVVVDAIDLFFVENVENNLIESFCGSEIASKGLLDYDARPGIRR